MADVKKTVEIAIKVTGLDKKNIDGLASVFEKIKTATDGVDKSLKLVKASLDQIKSPQGLDKTVESLKGIKDIKGAANLKKVTESLKMLGTIESFPKMGTLFNSLIKLNDVNGKGITSVALALKKLSAIPIASISTRLEKLNKAIGKLDKGGKLDNFKQFASDISKMKSSLDGATKAVTKTKGAMDSLGTSMQQSTKKARSFGDAIQTVLQFRLISSAIEKVKSSMVGGVQTIAEYDQALKNLQAITGATGFEVGLMGDKILEVASSTKFSATEISEGMKVIAQSGFTASESIGTMQAVSDLATGTLSDMAQTVDLVTTAMRVFNIDSSRSGEVADTFANAVNKSKLTIEKLRTAMNYLGPIARSAGVTFQELSSAMGTLANQGIRASTIGTGLRNVFAQLANPTEKLEKAAREAGVALADLDPNTKGLGNVIANLGMIVTDTGSAFDLFGKRGATAVLALNEGQDKFEDMLGDISKSGTAAQQAAIQMEGLGVSFKNLMDKLGVLAIALGEAGLTKIFKGLVDVARWLVDILIDLAGTITGKVVVTVIALTTALALLKLAMGAIAGSAIGAALASFTAGLSAMLTGTVSLTGAVYALWTALGPVGVVLGVISAIVGVGYWALFHDGAKESAEQAKKLAVELGNLDKNLTDYQIKTANMAEGSKELNDANLVLRKSLEEVANGTSSQASAAQEALLSIDPLTGAFNDAGKAVDDYQEKIQADKTLALKTALESTTESLNKSTGDWRRYADDVAKVGLQLIEIFKLIGKSAFYAVTFQWGKIDSAFDETINNMIKRAGDAQEVLDFKDAWNNNTKSLKELQDVIASWGDFDQMSHSQQRLTKDFKQSTIEGRKMVEELMDINNLTLDDTVEEFEKATKAAGITGDELTIVQGIIAQMKGDQKEGSGSSIIDNLIGKGGDFTQLDKVVDVWNNLEGVKDQASKKDVERYKRDIQASVDRMASLKAEAQERKASGKDDLDYWDEYHKKKMSIENEGRRISKQLGNDANLQDALAYKHLNEQKLKANNELATKFKDNDEKISKEKFKNETKYQQELKKLKEGSADDFDAQLNDYKDMLQKREVEYSRYNLRIEADVANGVITYAQGEEKKKQATLRFYTEAAIAAQKYFNEVSDEKGSDEYVKRQKMAVEATKAYDKEKRKLLREYNKEVVKAQKKLEKADAKSKKSMVKEEESYAKKVTAIEKKLADKIEAIKEALQKKDKKLQEDRVKNAKDTARDIADIERSGEDELEAIKRRGETEEQKESRDKKKAQEKLSQAEKLIAEAIRENDLDKLATGKELILDSKQLSKDLENQRDAYNGVEDALEALKVARNTEGQIKDNKVLEEQEKAKKKAIEDTKKAEAGSAEQKAELKKSHKTKMDYIKDEHVEAKRLYEKRFEELEVIQTILHRNQMKYIEEEAKLRDKLGGTSASSAGSTKSSSKAETDQSTSIAEDAKAQADIAIAEAERVAQRQKAIYNDQVIDAYNLTQAEVDAAQKTAEQKKAINDASRALEAESTKGYYEGISDTNLALLQEMAGKTKGIIKETNAEIEGETEKAFKDATVAPTKSIDELGKKFKGVRKELTEPIPINIGEVTEDDVEEVLPKESLKVPAEIEVDANDWMAEIDKATDLATLKGSEVETDVKVEVDPADQKEVDDLNDSLESIPKDKETNVKATTEGKGKVDDLDKAIKEMKDKVVNTTALTFGQSAVKALYASMKALKNRDVKAKAATSGHDRLEKMIKQIDAIKGKTVHINVNTTYTESKEHGGVVQGFAKGGQVFRRLANRFISAGGGAKDDVPAMLMKGEYVLKKSAVSQLGLPLLEKLNNLKFDPSSLVPGFASGGYVGNFSGGFSSLQKKLEFLLSPLSLLNTVTKKVGDPSFTDHMTTKVNRISTPMGAGYAKNMLGNYQDGIQRLASGGSVDSGTTFSQEKKDLVNEYNGEIASAKKAGKTEYAEILEDEKNELLVIAKELEETLSALKKELAEEIASINKDFKATTLALEEEYKSTIEEINNEKCVTDLAYNKAAGSDKQKLKILKKELIPISRQADIKPGDQVKGMYGPAQLRIYNHAVRSMVKAKNKEGPMKKEIKELEEGLKVLDQDRREDIAGYDKRANEAHSNYSVGIDDAKADRAKNLREAKLQNTQDVAQVKADSKEDSNNTKADTKADQENIKKETITTVSELKKEFRDALLELEKKWHRQAYTAERPKYGKFQMPYQKFADGGQAFPRRERHIPGSGTKDDVPALLMRGEYVLRKDAVRKYGVHFMDMLNWGKLKLPRFADGGEVMTSNMIDAMNKVSLPSSVVDATPRGGGLESNPQAQEIIKHQVTFDLGGKKYGPFQGDGMTMEGFITEMKIAQARA